MIGRALLIGCNYPESECALRGCVNDIDRVYKELLDTEVCEIRVLRDDVCGDEHETLDDRQYPTAKRIIDELLALAAWTRQGRDRRCLVWYSGHGTYVYDQSGDEDDGRDECIVPCDYERSGVITDDLLCAILHRFAPDSRVTMIFDCCHSGTICDLDKETGILADVRMLSGCLDNQTSADAFNLRGAQKWSGALTSAFFAAMGSSLTCTLTIDEFVGKIREYLQMRGFTQYPRFTSSRRLNMSTTLWDF